MGFIWVGHLLVLRGALSSGHSQMTAGAEAFKLASLACLASWQELLTGHWEGWDSLCHPRGSPSPPGLCSRLARPIWVWNNPIKRLVRLESHGYVRYVNKSFSGVVVGYSGKQQDFGVSKFKYHLCHM